MARDYSLTDAFAEVTNKIVAALEAGVAPWVCPWRRDSAGEGGGRPHNGVSGHVYRGVNLILTGMAGYGCSRWYTFKQAVDLKGRVRAGERGTLITFWQFVTPRASKGAEGEQPGDTAPKKIPILRHYHTWNAEQIAWPEGSKHAVVEPTSTDVADDNYENVEQVIAATGAEIVHHGVRACYSPATDAITVPVKSRFEDTAAYYATVLHELGHWTGHESRLARDLTGRFGTESYAAEELVAELAAAFACAELGIQGHLQHAEYLDCWIKVLKADKKAIFTVSRLAQEAADYIIGRRIAGGHDDPAGGQQEAA